MSSHVKAIFSFPGDRSPFVADAEIVRHAGASTGEIQGMGQRFTSFEDGNLNRLGRFLEMLYA